MYAYRFELKRTRYNPKANNFFQRERRKKKEEEMVRLLKTNTYKYLESDTSNRGISDHALSQKKATNFSSILTYS